MKRAKKLQPETKPEFTVRTITLSANELNVLQDLSQGASDFLGRTISSSAIIRALIRRIEKQGPSAADDLFFEVERELKAGTIWGRRK